MTFNFKKIDCIFQHKASGESLNCNAWIKSNKGKHHGIMLF